MDYSQQLALSYYKTIATLNEPHNIFLVQHQDSNKIYVKKIIDIYNIEIYQKLATHSLQGIPKIVDYFEINNQLIVIESYVSGSSLDDIIKNNYPSLSSIINYAIELCNILNHLHSLNPPIVHRDIKPSNIIITEHNHIVLIDFNAAKYYSEASDNDTILLGTKGYAAPEQFGFGSSSPKTDIYAVGILLKELTKHLPSIPSNLINIIEKCTMLNPSQRYDDVQELTKDLQKVLCPSQPDKTSRNFYLQLLPPGFRTLTVWKMSVAIPAYLFILWLSLSLEIQDTFGASLWIQRFFCLFMFLSIICGTCNYMNIHKYFPFCKSKYRIIRLFGIILLDIILVISLFIVLLIILSIFFPS